MSAMFGLPRTRARETFYNALVKADDKGLSTRPHGHGPDGRAVLEKGTSLTGYRVQRVLDAVDDLRGQYTMQTMNKVHAFIDNGNLGTAMHPLAKEQGHPGIDGQDRDLAKAFFQRVRTDPDFGRRPFSDAEMNEFAHLASKDCLEIKKERFETQHPHLAGLGHFPTTRPFHEARASLDKQPLANAPQELKPRQPHFEQVETTGRAHEDVLSTRQGEGTQGGGFQADGLSAGSARTTRWMRVGWRWQ